MAGKCVRGEQEDVYQHHERAHADAETFGEAEGEDRVVPEKAEKEDREVEKIAVHVLQDERKRGFAAILARPPSLTAQAGGSRKNAR